MLGGGKETSAPASFLRRRGRRRWVCVVGGGGGGPAVRAHRSCRAQQCAALYNGVLPCATVCSLVQRCAALCNCVQSCATVCSFVQLCAVLCSVEVGKSKSLECPCSVLVKLTMCYDAHGCLYKTCFKVLPYGLFQVIHGRPRFLRISFKAHAHVLLSTQSDGFRITSHWCWMGVGTVSEVVVGWRWRHVRTITRFHHSRRLRVRSGGRALVRHHR